MNSLRKTTLIALSTLAISCGGGGEGNDSEDTPSIVRGFTLDQVLSLDPGPTYQAGVTGSDSEGNTYGGSYRVVNGAMESVDQILVTPSRRNIILNPTIFISDPEPETIDQGETRFIDRDGDLILFSITEDGIIETSCEPDSRYRMPNIVSIGDSEQYPDLQCDDDSIIIRRWNVVDAGNGNAQLITISERSTTGESSTESRNLISQTVVQFTIDIRGNILAFRTTRRTPSPEFTLTYGS
ncbi:MAG: hypothetical protein COB04_09380 [Gammaproteobacteria bacterium]|nr:MAG: hypothetical protein COB04_09380 [Gammaproteobacteria bacterium]